MIGELPLFLSLQPSRSCPRRPAITVADACSWTVDFVSRSSIPQPASLNKPNFVPRITGSSPPIVYTRADTSTQPQPLLGWSNAGFIRHHAGADRGGQPDFKSTVANVLGQASLPTAINLASPSEWPSIAMAISSLADTGNIGC